MLAITLLTFKEVIRRRIILITLFLTLVFLVLFGTGVHYGYEEMAGQAGPLEMMLTQQFLALGLYFGSFIVAFCNYGGGGVSGESKRNHLRYCARPVKRSAIILGCWVTGLCSVSLRCFFISRSSSLFVSTQV